MRYRVYVYETISTCVEVEAADEDAAAEEVLTTGLPGVMFLNHEYPDEGEWEVDSVEPVGDGS